LFFFPFSQCTLCGNSGHSYTQEDAADILIAKKLRKKEKETCIRLFGQLNKLVTINSKESCSRAIEIIKV
jgi:hypothetical protein